MDVPETSIDELVSIALDVGFDAAVPLDVDTLVAREDVRAMCAADKCHAYGKNWTCPPECGTLDECSRRMREYVYGILVQTIGALERATDWRGMLAVEQRHLESFGKCADEVCRRFPDALCLGSGGCRICTTCAYPEPCRYPGRATSSMEAYGLFVTDVCRKNGLLYHYGENTITYTSCFLVRPTEYE